jgi:DNA-binding transcriptional regulator YhcF (GntR family)
MEGRKRQIYNKLVELYGTEDVFTQADIRNYDIEMMAIPSGTFNSTFAYFMKHNYIERVAKGEYKFRPFDSVEKKHTKDSPPKKSDKHSTGPIWEQIYNYLFEEKRNWKKAGAFQFDYNFIADNFVMMNTNTIRNAIKKLYKDNLIYRLNLGWYGVSQKTDKPKSEKPKEIDPLTRAINALNDFQDAMEDLIPYIENLETRFTKLCELQEPMVKKLEKYAQLIRQRKFINVNTCGGG